MSLPPIIGRLIGDDSHFRNTMRGAAGAVSVVGGALAAVGVASFFKSAVMGASDFAETMSKVGVVFGDAQKDVTGFANQMAKDFGIPKTQILDAASSIGLIGKASGLSQKDAAGMSTQLAKMAVDASSFYNVPLEEALGAIRSGLVGEAEPMRRFGVLLNAQAVDAEAARLGLQKVNGAYTEGAKAQARASLIMKGMSDANGDLERTQGSLSNRLRELKGRFTNFTTEIGTKAIPAVLGLLDAGEGLGKKLGPVLKQVGFGVAAMKSAFSGEGVTSNGFVGAMERIGVSASGVFDRVKEAWPQIQATIIGVVRTVVGVVQDNWPRIKEVVVEALTTIRAVISGWVTFISTIWQNFGSQIMNVVQGAWTFVLNIIDAALNIIRGVIDVVCGLITGDWGRVWDGIKSIFSGVWDAIKAVLSAALTLIQNVLSAAWEIIKGIFTGAWDAIKNGTIDGIKAVLGFYISLPGRILGALGDLGSLLFDAGKKLLRGFIDGIFSMFGEVKDTLGNLVGKLTSWKGPPAKDARLLYNAGRLVMGGFDAGLQDGIPGVRDTLMGATSMIGGMGSAGLGAGGASASTGPMTIYVVVNDQIIGKALASGVRDEMIRMDDTFRRVVYGR